MPWAWALNGFASVVGAVLAIHFGFIAVVGVAVALYLLAAAGFPESGSADIPPTAQLS